MRVAWAEARSAYAEAAGWFVRTVGRAEGRWEEPGLGDWDVRALVGHTSRAFLTVEEYLARPASQVEIDDAAGYFRATSAIAAGAAVAQRGRDAGEALGPEPVAAVAAIAERVLDLVEGCAGSELVTTIVGGMRLADYLPTRTFELAVHTADLATALGAPLEVPPAAAAQALAIASELAVANGAAGRLLLVATGRPDPEPRVSVL
jgi:hypothetical protein